jgi:hypothetical protein
MDSDGPEPVRWTCDENTRRGDVALLYRAEIGDFSHLFEVTEDAVEISEKARSGFAWNWWCWADVAVNLSRPIPLQNVRREPGLREWIAAEVNFHGTAFPVEPAEWRALLDLASPSDRIALRHAGG